MTIPFAAVPPMPMPSIPGGHQPAPIFGTISSTQSTIESLGFSIANLVLFSDPPPLAATVMSSLSPGTTRVWMTAGVLSFVFVRLNAGSATIEARSRFSGCIRSEEHTSELQSLMRISYAVFCLKKKQQHQIDHTTTHN